MDKIITHPGTAHRDDILAVALLLSAGGGTATVYRSTPTDEDLDDPKTAVIDIGGRHQPELLNFDHHQFPRDHPPQCALSLVLKHLYIYEAATEFWPWLPSTEVSDTRGHQGLVEHLGLPTNTAVPKQLYSPFDILAKLWMTEEAVLVPGSFMHTYLVKVGRTLHEDLKAQVHRQSLLCKVLLTRGVSGLLVADVRTIPGNENPTLGLEHFLAKRKIEADVTITNDDRDAGFVIFRRNKATSKLDFSRVRGNPCVRFAHAGGFVAKLNPETPDEVIHAIIESSKVR